MRKIHSECLVFSVIISCFLHGGCASSQVDNGDSISGNASIIEEECATVLIEAQENQEVTESVDLTIPKYSLRKPEGEPAKFIETWGYVMRGREEEYLPDSPITDVCYFSADINCYGELTGVPVRSKLKTGNARCHLVIACDSRAATHLALSSQYDNRKKLLKDIVKAAAGYNGVQLDLEYIPLRDKKDFISFIGDLRYMLGDKMLSVCVPARFKRGTDDIYPYADIAMYCDRVFVMCYDEHWSTSKPGAVASPEWCKKVLAYAIKDIPTKKLVMGIPFYGRTWASETTNGAWYNSGANRIMTEHGVEEVIYEDDIPSFKYIANVEVTGYFTDTWAALNLCRIYEEAGVQKVGFWRLGQEAPDFWDWITVR